MNEHRCKTLVGLVFFMTMFRVEKIETPSIIRKEAQKLDKRKKIEERCNEKNSKNSKYRVYGLGFVLILRCEFH
jgi:hypothetical protein